MDTSSAKVEIIGTLTPAESVGAHYVHLRPRLSLGVIGTMLVLLVLASFVLPFVSPKFRTDSEITGFLFLATTLGFLVVLGAVWLPRRIRQLHHQTKTAGLSVRLTADDSGFDYEREMARLTIPWAHVHKWRKSRKFLLVYLNDEQFLIIPARLIRDDASREILEEMLNRHVGRAG